jgi:alpha-tubulin suppressor-like RCC1 family protein
MRRVSHERFASYWIITLIGFAALGIAGAAQNSLVAWGGGVALNAPTNLSNIAVVGPGLALKRDGTVYGWAGQYPTNPPPEATNVIALAREHSTVLLRRDGTVISWEGQLLSSNAVAVSSAVSYGAAALRRDGTLDWLGSFLNLPPDDARSNIAAITGGGYATVDLLYTDGTVWSAALAGMLPGLTNVVATSRNPSSVVWLKSDGTVASAGYGAESQPADLTNIVAVSAGWGFFLALQGNGTVVSWGTIPATNVPSWLSNVVAISAGYDHALALRADGTVVAWGDNTSGQTNVPPQLTNVASIFAADHASFAIVGDSPPTLLSQLPDEVTWAGRAATFTLQAIGSPPLHFQWQLNGETIPGATNFFYRIERATPANSGLYSVLVSNARGTAVSEARLTVRDDPFFPLQPTNQAILYGDNVTFTAAALGSQPAAYQWFFNGQPIGGATSTSLTITNLSRAEVGQYWVTASNPASVRTSAVATLTPLVLAAWGDNGFYNLNSVPPTLSNIAAISAGLDDNFVLLPDGTVTGWGEAANNGPYIGSFFSNTVAIAGGDYYLLGLRQDGTMLEAGRRGMPPGLRNAVGIAVGWYHSLALFADGTVAAWGSDADVPAGLKDAVSIAAGGKHSLALRSNGTVVAWMDGAYGQTNVPAGLADVVAIAGGGLHSLALREDGTVVAWGYNQFGQTNVPAGLSNVIAIAAGTYHSLALRADGTVMAWGENPYYPITVPTNLHNVVAISAFGYQSLALVAEGLSAPAPAILTPGWSQGAFSLRVNALRGKSYYLQHATSLSPPNWRLLRPVPGDNSVKTLADPAASLPHGFYRVWQKPGC